MVDMQHTLEGTYMQVTPHFRQQGSKHLSAPSCLCSTSHTLLLSVRELEQEDQNDARPHLLGQLQSSQSVDYETCEEHFHLPRFEVPGPTLCHTHEGIIY